MRLSLLCLVRRALLYLLYDEVVLKWLVAGGIGPHEWRRQVFVFLVPFGEVLGRAHVHLRIECARDFVHEQSRAAGGLSRHGLACGGCFGVGLVDRRVPFVSDQRWKEE